MKNFDESYQNVYLEVMYPQASADEGELPQGYLFTPPQEREKENAMRQAQMSLSGMAVADTAAGMVKGAAAGAVGLPGDLLAIGRGIYEMGAKGADLGVLDAFLYGINEGFILPTTDDVSKFLTERLGPVVPAGGELDQVQAFREQKAATGEMVGEFLAPGGVATGVAKGVKAATKTMRPSSKSATGAE
jgi:hypothetical protein